MPKKLILQSTFSDNVYIFIQSSTCKFCHCTQLSYKLGSFCNFFAFCWHHFHQYIFISTQIQHRERSKQKIAAMKTIYHFANIMWRTIFTQK